MTVLGMQPRCSAKTRDLRRWVTQGRLAGACPMAREDVHRHPSGSGQQGRLSASEQVDSRVVVSHWILDTVGPCLSTCRRPTPERPVLAPGSRRRSTGPAHHDFTTKFQ